MKSIRKFTYAVLLLLSGFTLAPGQATAQEAAGTFTLTHQVHWQEAVVPAGTYRFTVASTGAGSLLTLRNVSDDGRSFMMLATDMAESKPTDISQLVLLSGSSGSFVSAMQLPETGVTLHFAVPPQAREMAQAGVAKPASAVR